MAETEHAADEAGGEVVYASDGMPPIVLPTRVSSTAAVNEDQDQSVLDSGGTSATQAFEVFSGKLYPVKTTATTTTSTGISETPTQRLARLQQEVAQLEQDLSSATTSSEEDPALMQLVADLKTRLQGQAGVAKHQQDMTHTMHQQLEEWHAAQKSSRTAAAADSASEPPSSSGVVYELYGGGVPQASMEERLLQIEALVGSSAASSAKPNQSLLSRLHGMETLLQNLDPKALEQASAKAKVIRSDLEAASKARNKLASAATFRKEDAKTISALYDQMVQLEGLSDHLPALVARLQQLANLHAQNSSFSGRLTQSEKEVTQLQSVLKHLEDTVSKVEAGVVDNVKVVEQNMKQLDERLQKL